MRILETEDGGRKREVATNALVLTGLPACRGTGSYSEMGSEKFSNTAKSGYNKGTIRSDIWYLVVSKDVRRHRLISIDYITALLSRQRSRVRVSSSPPFFLKHLRWFSRNPRGPKRARFSVLFCVPFRSVPFLRCRFPHAATSPDDDCDVPFASRENTKDKTAA